MKRLLAPVALCFRGYPSFRGPGGRATYVCITGCSNTWRFAGFGSSQLRTHCMSWYFVKRVFATPVASICGAVSTEAFPYQCRDRGEVAYTSD